MNQQQEPLGWKSKKKPQLLRVSDVVVWIFSKSEKYPHCLAIFLIPKKFLIFSLCLEEWCTTLKNQQQEPLGWESTKKLGYQILGLSSFQYSQVWIQVEWWCYNCKKKNIYLWTSLYKTKTRLYLCIEGSVVVMLHFWDGILHWFCSMLNYVFI